MSTLLTVTDKNDWRPPRKGEKEYLYAVEYARSGRARCRKCSEYIASKAIRFAIPIRDPRGEYGYIPAWQHLECSRIDAQTLEFIDEQIAVASASSPSPKSPKSPASKSRAEYVKSKLFGIADLKIEDQQKVVDEILNPVKPQHLKELDPDELVKRPPMPEIEPPDSCLQHLLRYQKEALWWMKNQEEATEHKGGILALEMGMGKTISMLSLIAMRRSELAPTLVVAPVSALLSWKEEIANQFAPDTFNVYTLAKNSKAVNKDDLLAADIVLTSYPVLELAWRRLVDDNKVKCKYCGKNFAPKKLVVHNKYFCGPEAKKTMKQMKQEKSGGATKSSSTSKVQSKKTIQKGLRTLDVQLDEDDDDDDDDKNEDESQSKKSVTKKNRGGGNDSIAGPMGMYRELMQEAGRKVRSRWDSATKAKEDDSSSSSSSSSSSDDDDDDNDDEEDKEKADVKTPQNNASASGKKKAKVSNTKKSKKRRGDTSSDDDDDDDDDNSSSSSSPDTDDDDDDSSSLSSNSSSSDDEDSEAEKSQKKLIFNCPDCEFRLQRFAFCPKTGQPHPRPKTKAELAREKAGALLKPLPDDDDDTGADVVDLDNSALHAIRWFRVVLDEAHRIKGRTTSTARAAFALKGTHKWCVTGTPLQNRVGDLYSLLRFIRMAPFARYYCSHPDCKCNTLSHPFTIDITSNFCVFCGHGPIQHYSYFNRHILNPITRYGYIGDGRKAMLLLAGNVLQHIMLRRTKAERAADMHLPPCTVTMKYIDLTDAERDFYESLYKKSAAKFDTFVNKGTLLHNYAHIFQLLSRLRQALDHPYLVLFGSSSGLFADGDGDDGKDDEGGTREVQMKTNESDAPPTTNNSLTKEEEEEEKKVKIKKDKKTNKSGQQKQPENGGNGDDLFASAAAAMGLVDQADAATPSAASDNKKKNNKKSSRTSSSAMTLLVRPLQQQLPAAISVPSEVCGICQESTDPRTRIHVRPCHHAFHALCLREYVESCPVAVVTATAAAQVETTKKNGKKASNKNKNVDRGEDDGESAPSGICCPRCFVGINVDLQQLAAAGEGEGSDSEPEDVVGGNDDDNNNNNNSSKNNHTNNKPNSSGAESRRRQRNDPDNTQNESSMFAAFNMMDFGAVQAPNMNGDHGDNDDDQQVDASTRNNKNNKANSSSATNHNFAGGTVTSSSSSSSILRKIDSSRFQQGTKLTAIVDEVKAIKRRGEKTIVFSQFGSMLDLIEFSLERTNEIRAVKLVGSMPLSSRLASLRAFRANPDIHVILISLKAGGEGLNLQVANNVILADPWWNPAVEMQAIQRAHRIGQTKPVNAIRFCTRRTVEDRMMTLQDKKMLVFEGTVDGKFDSLQRLSEDDLRFLFSR